MDEQSFKQRIVGAIVLIALAVIFIPMLLPGHGDSGFTGAGSTIPPRTENVKKITVLELESPITEPPQREVIRTPIDERSSTIEEPSIIQDAPPQDVTRTTPDVEDTNGAAAPPPTSKPAEVKTEPKAWAVQVGSFSQKENAMRLRDNLRTKKYKAFVEKIQLASAVSYRVRVGPYVKRSQAEKMQQDLNSKMKIKGIVVTHP